MALMQEAGLDKIQSCLCQADESIRIYPELLSVNAEGVAAKCATLRRQGYTGDFLNKVLASKSGAQYLTASLGATAEAMAAFQAAGGARGARNYQPVAILDAGTVGRIYASNSLCLLEYYYIVSRFTSGEGIGEQKARSSISAF